MNVLRNTDDVADALQRDLASITGVSNAMVTVKNGILKVDAQVTDAGKPEFRMAVEQYRRDTELSIVIDRRIR